MVGVRAPENGGSEVMPPPEVEAEELGLKNNDVPTREKDGIPLAMERREKEMRR